MQRILYGVRKRYFQKYNFLVFMKLFTTKTKKEHENTLYEKKKNSRVFLNVFRTKKLKRILYGKI